MTIMSLICLDQWYLVFKYCKGRSQILLKSCTTILSRNLKLTKIHCINCKDKQRLWNVISKNRSTIKSFILSIENLSGHEDKLPPKIDFLEVRFGGWDADICAHSSFLGPDDPKLNLAKINIKFLKLIANKDKYPNQEWAMKSPYVRLVEHLYLKEFSFNFCKNGMPRLKSLEMRGKLGFRGIGHLKALKKLVIKDRKNLTDDCWDFNDFRNNDVFKGLINLESLTLEACELDIPKMPLLRTLCLIKSSTKKIFGKNLKFVTIEESKNDINIESTNLRILTIKNNYHLVNYPLNTHLKVFSNIEEYC